MHQKHQQKEFNNRFISPLSNVDASKWIKGSAGANLKAMQKEGEYYRSRLCCQLILPFLGTHGMNLFITPQDQTDKEITG